MMIRWLLVFCCCSVAATADYVLLAVSGGLQHGFPDHNKLHPTDGLPPIYIGRALVRGTKAFLDVMEEGWRQYAPEPEQPLINSGVLVSGCHEHANQYWVYAVDEKQAVLVLLNEPRLLSITPDAGLVDLESSATDEVVRNLALSEIRRLGFANTTHVALPIVVATWFQASSFVPSPTVQTLEDGTQVTNYPESLALWAGLDDADRTSDNADDRQRYWDGIRRAIRAAEADRGAPAEWPLDCQRLTRLGVDSETLRINYHWSEDRLHQVLHQGNNDEL